MYNIRMPRPSNVSYPRSEYYRKYYLNNKFRYRMNYEEKKQREQLFNEIYEPYGGERRYYKDCLLKMFKESTEEVITDISNINLN